MNASKHIRDLLSSALSSDLYILSESPQSTPFLSGLVSEQLLTLPCSDTLLSNTALGMAISGSRVLISMSTDKEIDSLLALLKEESYGSEFPLSVIFLIPTLQAPSTLPCVNTTYCRSGIQLWSHINNALQMHKPQIIYYNPAALFDHIAENPPESTNLASTIHSSGTHISVFVCGSNIEEAKEFAHKYEDVELIELNSITPLCNKTIRISVQKTGRALLINAPLHLTKEILDSCFWHLEAQIEHTKNPNIANLTQLRSRLLET